MSSTGDGVSRRRFLSGVVVGGLSGGLTAGDAFGQAPGLVGLTRKSGRVIEGGFVFDSHVEGHAWRDDPGFRGSAAPGVTGAPTAGSAPTAGDAAAQFPFDISGFIRRATVVIVGGGIAGLSAAWRLMRAGVSDLVVLELESAPGGNARYGENEVTAYPWGAHYVPLPGAAGGIVRELFGELGVYAEGAWDERHLVHAPRERLFIHGRWEDGLEPAVGPTRRDRDQIARFADRMHTFAATGAFTVPSASGRARGGPAAVRDDESMASWMAREGFDSPWLQWQVDYACRDDYGALARDVSAWAGVHYFAARNDDDEGPLTWPEGNGWVVRRLTAQLGERLRPSTFAKRVVRYGAGWQVETPTNIWRADAVVIATPWFIAQRLVEGWPRADVTYSPWLTANLTLDRWPRERGGGGPAWDNVIFDSPSLGYVVATHQHLRQHVPRTVWTYYWALAQQSPRDARTWLLGQSWVSLRDAILADLARAHPDIAECVTRVDVLRLGHAMARPTPGFLSSAARRGLEGRDDGLFYAHSDRGGLPLFEEALAAGVDAADGVIRRVAGRRG